MKLKQTIGDNVDNDENGNQNRKAFNRIRFPKLLYETVNYVCGKAIVLLRI